MKRTWNDHLETYCGQLEALGFSAYTCKHKKRDVHRFMTWFKENLAANDMMTLNQITEEAVEAFHVSLVQKGVGLKSQSNYLVSLKTFFKWLVKRGHIPFNPTRTLQIPTIPKRLGMTLTHVEVEQLINMPDTRKALGLRDRALLEVLYSTGLRQEEMKKLKVNAIDRANDLVMVRQGKNRKDRLVPIGERALFWLDRYLNEVRPKLACGEDEGVIILNHHGRPFAWSGLSVVVAKYKRKAGIKKKGACHLLRHAMATHMLEGGANIRYIQAMLGHAELTTTQLYTHVSGKALKAVHQRTHPLEKQLKK